MPKSVRALSGPEEFLAANRQRRAELKHADRVPSALGASVGVRGRGLLSWRARRRPLKGLLVLLVVGLAISTAVLAYRIGSDDARPSGITDDERGRAMTTAQQYAVALTTYDPANYADLDRRIRQISTPEFAKTYIRSSQQARAGNSNAKAVSQATVSRAGLVSISAGIAVVLVALDQTVTAPELSSQVPEGIPYQSRVVVTLRKQQDRWLLDDLVTV